MTEIVVKNIHEKPKTFQNVVSGKSFEDFLQSRKRLSGLTDMGAYNLRSSTTEILNYCNPHDAVQY